MFTSINVDKIFRSTFHFSTQDKAKKKVTKLEKVRREHSVHNSRHHTAVIEYRTD